METIYISDIGNDANDGLSREKPVRSWRRAVLLRAGHNEMVLIEGNATLKRLTSENHKVGL
jgi:hypothetical protein